MKKRKLRRYSDVRDIEIGDFILFQEYKQSDHDGKEYSYEISKPTFAIYLGMFIADQTIGFNYVKWVNDKRIVKLSNEHVTDYKDIKQVDGIEYHVEWNDYLDVLGHWKSRPNWKEIIKAYRKQNVKEQILSNEIVWNYL